MAKRSGRFVVARVAAGAGLLVLAMMAGPTTGVARDVSLIGCPQHGVEAGCLIMKVDGKLYDVTAAKPKPQVGVLGVVHGTVGDKVSLCMQGTILSPATWQAMPGGTCSVPNAK